VSYFIDLTTNDSNTHATSFSSYVLFSTTQHK